MVIIFANPWILFRVSFEVEVGGVGPETARIVNLSNTMMMDDDMNNKVNTSLNMVSSPTLVQEN